MTATPETRAPADYEIVDRRTVVMALFAMVIAVGAGLAPRAPRVVVGIVSRSDLLAAHAPRLRAARRRSRARTLLGR